MIVVPSSGNPRPRIFVIGERPGKEEVRARPPENFIGPAGQELWSRLEHCTGLTRDDCYVANLVRTYSPKPPSPKEIAEWSGHLLADLLRIKPAIIVTVGYHAARHLLPQFAQVSGDHFHGLPFGVRLGRLRPFDSVVVPVVHSAAALRQPGLYQNQLTNDLRMVGRVLAGKVGCYAATQPGVDRVGLATTIHLAHDGVLGLDTEGNIHYPWAAECITLAAGGGVASLVQPRNAALAQDAIDAADTVAIHHAKHDLKALHKLGLHVDRVDDTMVMAYCLGLPQGMKELAARVLRWQMSDYEDLVQPLDDLVVRAALERAHEEGSASWAAAANAEKAAGRHGKDTRRFPRTGGGTGRDVDDHRLPKRGLTSIQGILTKPADQTVRKRWEGSTFSHFVPLPPPPTWKDLPQAVGEPYALTDAVAHRALRNALMPALERRGLQRVYRLDMSVLPLLIRNEEVGLACDAKALTWLSDCWSVEYEKICRRINRLAGQELNPISGDQVSDVLFEVLGIRPTRLTKGGKHYTTEDKYLKARRQDHEIIPLVLEARQINKYKGTYTDKLPKLLVDGRYHPNWKYTRTATGRLAEEIILLIPKHSKRAKEIRNAFHAAEGNVLVSCDLSQIELRAMAHLSGDRELLGSYERGEDVHAAVAHALLGAPKGRENQDESLHRLPAKTANFGIINGMTEYGMLDQLHEAGQMQWDIESVKEMLDGWWRLHKGVQRYWEEQIAKCERKGYVEDLFGRRRYISAIWSTSDQVRREAERQCLCPIQATADGISKVWNARIWKRVIRPRDGTGSGNYCEPWLRVHDDTILEVATRISTSVEREVMQLVPDMLCIPTTAEAKRAVRWGELA